MIEGANFIRIARDGGGGSKAESTRSEQAGAGARSSASSLGEHDRSPSEELTAAESVETSVNLDLAPVAFPPQRLRERRSRLRAAVFAEARNHPSYSRTLTGLEQWDWIVHLQKVARRLDAAMPAPLGEAEADDTGALVARTTAPWSHESESQQSRAINRERNKRTDNADRDAAILAEIEAGEKQQTVAERHGIKPRQLRNVLKRLRDEKAAMHRSAKAAMHRRSTSAEAFGDFVLPDERPRPARLPEGVDWNGMQDRLRSITDQRRRLKDEEDAILYALSIFEFEAAAGAAASDKSPTARLVPGATSAWCGFDEAPQAGSSLREGCHPPRTPPPLVRTGRKRSDRG